MATIARTASGTWKAVVRRQGWPQAIKTFRLKRDAEDWARGVEDEMVRGVYSHRATHNRMTLDQALDRYLSEVTPSKRPGSQVRDHTKAKPLRKALGDYALGALTPDLIGEYRNARLKTIDPRSGRSYSPSTVRLELALLSHLYNTAIREWSLGLVSNPVQAVRKPVQSPGRTRRLTGDEETRLLATCDRHSNPMFSWIVRLALTTAMRYGEIVSLTTDQIDLERRVVRLTQTKNGSSRTVPLSTKAVTVLRDALACPLRKDSALVFPGETGQDGQRRPYIINRTWQAAVRAAGIKDLRFHDLRHEAVSRLIERGLSWPEVCAISGHKSAQMSLRYIHLHAEALAAKLG